MIGVLAVDIWDMNVGRIIVEHEQNNNERAAYGKQQLCQISKELTKEIELKTTKLMAEAVGQLNMYLNYYAAEVNDEQYTCLPLCIFPKRNN